jgi:hypothetical protein
VAARVSFVRRQDRVVRASSVDEVIGLTDGLAFVLIRVGFEEDDEQQCAVPLMQMSAPGAVDSRRRQRKQ